MEGGTGPEAFTVAAKVIVTEGRDTVTTQVTAADGVRVTGEVAAQAPVDHGLKRRRLVLHDDSDDE